MAEPKKFIFNNNYSTAPENIKKLQEKRVSDARSILQNELENAKQQAFQQGVEQGEKQALERLKQELNSHIDNISMNISQLERYKQELYKIFEEQSMLTIRHLAKSMFFNSEEFFPEKLLDQSVKNSLQNMPYCTKVLIKVPLECKHYIEDTQIKEKLTNRGVSDFNIIEDPSLTIGESQIEWDSSGVFSSKKESLNKINSTINAFLNQEDINLSESMVKIEKEESQPITNEAPDEGSIEIENSTIDKNNDEIVAEEIHNQ